MTLLMTIELPYLPPTQNHAYSNHPMGGRRLTEKARLFKKKVTNHVARKHVLELKQMEPNQPYELHVTFWLAPQDLFNKSYPKKTKNRYKRVDTVNRAKLLEDALSDAFGLDDSHNFVIRLEKRPGDAPATEIEVHRKEDEWIEPGGT